MLLSSVCTRLTYFPVVNMPLNYLPLDKMPTILADDIFKCIFLNEHDRIPIICSQESNWQ